MTTLVHIHPKDVIRFLDGKAVLLVSARHANEAIVIGFDGLDDELHFYADGRRVKWKLQPCDK